MEYYRKKSSLWGTFSILVQLFIGVVGLGLMVISLVAYGFGDISLTYTAGGIFVGSVIFAVCMCVHDIWDIV